VSRPQRYVSEADPEDAPRVGEMVSRAKQPYCERQDTPTPQRSRADGAHAHGDHPGGQHGKPADHAGRQAAGRPDIDSPGSRLHDAAGGHEGVDAMRHAQPRSVPLVGNLAHLGDASLAREGVGCPRWLTGLGGLLPFLLPHTEKGEVKG